MQRFDQATEAVADTVEVAVDTAAAVVDTVVSTAVVATATMQAVMGVGINGQMRTKQSKLNMNVLRFSRVFRGWRWR